MAITVAIKAISRGTEGTHAARTDVAASPTPSNTSAHDADSATAAVIRVRVAIAIPIPARAIRAALPSGLAAQA